jgi:hypothetical protein
MVGIVSVRSVRIIFTASSIALPFASATPKEGVLHTLHGVPDGGNLSVRVLADGRGGLYGSTKDVFFTSLPGAKELGRKPFFTAFAGPTAIAPTPRSFSTPLGISMVRPPAEALTVAVLRSSCPPRLSFLGPKPSRTTLGTAATEAILSRNWSSIPLAIFTEPRSSVVPAVASRMAAPCIASVPVPQDGPRPFYTAFRFHRAGQTETCRLALS